ncbi:dirigent protein 1-like [Phalaenopsis equestris]|uniref:dirigent protein 1-like n=1 Tax=Phalaenopsis equestris TaxID=78828 RepID=UPI0009E2E6C3|nr:dirigent protein 1-like [Phalaenopsis equestris]
MASITFPLAIFVAITLTLTLKISSATAETNERETRLHFYMQERDVAPNVTIIKVVSGSDDQSDGSLKFGDLCVFDNALTEGYYPTTRHIGRLHGTAVTSTLDGSVGLFSVNLIFTDFHPWTGSSLTAIGGFYIQKGTGELQAVGGTGEFRKAQGYVLLSRLPNEDINSSIFELEVVLLNN